MRTIKTLACSAVALTLAALPSTAFADDVRPFNDGNGTCGLISCGPAGCQIIDQHPCPNEMRTDG